MTLASDSRVQPGVPRKSAPWLWAIPAIIITLLIHYVAVMSGAWYAFTDWNGISPAANFIGLDNFRQIMADRAARGALINSVVIAICFVVLTNALGLMIAVALNRSLKTRNFIRALFFIPVVLSSLSVSYIWQFMFDYRGPINLALQAVGLGDWQRGWLGDPATALWTIIIVSSWQFVGLTMVIYLAGLQGIPDELDEAAAVDGATTFYRFRRITLPMLAPAMTIAFTLTLIRGLRIFDQVIGLTNGGPARSTETLATALWREAWVNGRFGYGTALALMLSVLIVICAVAQLVILRNREKNI